MTRDELIERFARKLAERQGLDPDMPVTMMQPCLYIDGKTVTDARHSIPIWQAYVGLAADFIEISHEMAAENPLKVVAA